jgi:hypothetical protein
VAIGAKRIETRGWSTSYRGPLAIHAAKGLGPVGGMQGLRDLCCSEPFISTLKAAGIDMDQVDVDVLPRGAIVAVCELANCVSTGLFSSVQHGEDIWQIPPGNMSREYSFGDYSPNRYAWLLANIRALPTPVPATGALSLWEYEGELPDADR